MVGNPQGTAQCGSVPSGVDPASSYIATTYFEQGTALLRQGHYGESEWYLREALRLCPHHAGALNNLGTAIWQQNRAQEAEILYRRALALAPDDFGILNNLGNALWEQSRSVEAIPYYQQALRLQPDAPEAQMNLGLALSDCGEFDAAEAWIRAALRRRPDWPEALDNLGVTFARRGNWDDALRYYEQALGLRPDFPEAHRNGAFIWLAHGDFERGWPEYEWRLKCRNHRGLTVNCPRWAGEDLGGRSILLHAEQGLGDTLQFVRFATMVRRRGGRVALCCPAPLVRLLALCPDLDHVSSDQAPLPVSDFHAPLMSLPAIFGTTLATLPATTPDLVVDEATIERWRPVVARAIAESAGGAAARRQAPARCFTIGIAWQGNPRYRVDRWRSFRLAQLAPLAELPGVCLISLQKGEGTEQLREPASRFPVAVLHDPARGDDDQRDFLDTAAVMSQLDLVIAPDSAVAHLAGSLGVRVWVPLPAVSDWRWLIGREDSPWYPTMTLFRQASPGDWDGVFQRMASILGRELNDGPAPARELDRFRPSPSQW